MAITNTSVRPGSIRIPALCCGTYGFKPTGSRIPHGGLQPCYDTGLPTITPSVGPLANDIDALAIFTKAVLGARPALYDSAALDVGWRDVQSQIRTKLRIGILPEDPTYPLHPPVRNAVAGAARLLEQSGHEIVHLQPNDCCISDAVQVAWAMFGLDNTGEGILEAGGETPNGSLRRVAEEWAKVSHDFVGELDSLEGLDKLSGLHLKKAAIADIWRKLWNSHGLDAVVGPGARTTAVEHDQFGLLPYTVFLNLLDVSQRLRGSNKHPTDDIVPCVRHSLWKGSKSGDYRANRSRDRPSRAPM